LQSNILNDLLKNSKDTGLTGSAIDLTDIQLINEYEKKINQDIEDLDRKMKDYKR